MLTPPVRCQRKLASLALLSLLLVLGCTPADPTTNEPARDTLDVPAALAAPLEAHGGFALWRSFGAVAYDLHRGEITDRQLVDLQSRTVHISGDRYQVGFDGTDAWVYPHRDSLRYGGSPRFYASTYFYFFALPFVFADPGVRQDTLGQRELDGKRYNVVQMHYGDDMGDSPDDTYIAYFDAETHRLHLVLYTVTYGRTVDPTATPRYGSMRYATWQTVNGLLVPEEIVSHRWQEDRLGEARSSTYFRNVVFEQARPDSSQFAAPEGATLFPPPDAS